VRAPITANSRFAAEVLAFFLFPFLSLLFLFSLSLFFFLFFSRAVVITFEHIARPPGRELRCNIEKKRGRRRRRGGEGEEEEEKKERAKRNHRSAGIYWKNPLSKRSAETRLRNSTVTRSDENGVNVTSADGRYATAADNCAYLRAVNKDLACRRGEFRLAKFGSSVVLAPYPRSLLHRSFYRGERKSDARRS